MNFIAKNILLLIIENVCMWKATFMIVQEHEGFRRRGKKLLNATLQDISIKAISWDKDKHIWGRVVDFFLCSICLAGSITYWIFTEEQSEAHVVWHLGLLCLDTAQKVLQHQKNARSQCSCSVCKHCPPTSSLVHKPLPSLWKRESSLVPHL